VAPAAFLPEHSFTEQTSDFNEFVPARGTTYKPLGVYRACLVIVYCCMDCHSDYGFDAKIHSGLQTAKQIAQFAGTDCANFIIFAPETNRKSL
jgi:hypothetical protein